MSLITPGRNPFFNETKSTLIASVVILAVLGCLLLGLF